LLAFLATGFAAAFLATFFVVGFAGAIFAAFFTDFFLLVDLEDALAAGLLLFALRPPKIVSQPLAYFSFVPTRVIVTATIPNH